MFGLPEGVELKMNIHNSLCYVVGYFVMVSSIAACEGGSSSSISVTAHDAAASVPAPVIFPSSSDVFYGINGHWIRGGSYALASPVLQKDQLGSLRTKMYRNEVFDEASAITLAEFARTMASIGGITVYPVIIQNLTFADEQSAYNASYKLAQEIVRVQRYAHYEVTNELAPQCLVGWVDGVLNTQYDNEKFKIARGIIRGLIAGIKSIDSTGKIIIGGNTWMHYAFDQMLASGTQPDGTTGHPMVSWDITSWHWYSEQGSIEHACGGTGCYNVIGVLQSFGKPIWMTEVGMRPDFPGTQREAGAYLADNMLGALLAIAPKYDIESLQIYELYDDPPGGEGAYGIMQNDARTPKPAWTAVREFIWTHPR